MGLRSTLSIAVLGFVLAAGCARKPDDTAVVTNIKAQMFSDPQLKDANLKVVAKNGQVTLTGTVSSDAARLDAYKIAMQTAGVSKVNDQMIVATAQTAQVETPQPSETPQATSEPAQEEVNPAPVPKKTSHEHRRKERVKSQERQAAEVAQDQTPDASADQETTPAPNSADAAPPVSQAPAVPASAPTAPTPAPAAVPVTAPPPPQPTQVEIPAGTTMSIRMIDGIDSSVNQPGEIFHASLDSSILIDNQVVVPKDADVYVRLASVSSAGHIKGKSELELQLVKLQFQGQSYPLTSGTYTLAGQSRGKDTAKKVGAGAILGTLIGAIAGGGKGAAVGAAVGAGAGGAYQEATRGKQVKVPSESKLDFQLQQPVTVTVMPHSVPAED
ncbi:MAG TPA: BON domain-containing protein [Candidatus Acidoferrales bacterium]|nr:BON domain-containing protein [Candidatus Acidoferrales bacterium]